MDMKLFFDEKKTGPTWPHEAELVAEAKATREMILTQVWTPHVKDEFDLTSLIQRRHCGITGNPWLE